MWYGKADVPSRFSGSDLNILMRDDGEAPVPKVGDEAAGSDWGDAAPANEAANGL